MREDMRARLEKLADEWRERAREIDARPNVSPRTGLKRSGLRTAFLKCADDLRAALPTQEQGVEGDEVRWLRGYAATMECGCSTCENGGTCNAGREYAEDRERLLRIADRLATNPPRDHGFTNLEALADGRIGRGATLSEYIMLRDEAKLALQALSDPPRDEPREAEWGEMECGICGAGPGVPCSAECDAQCDCPTCINRPPRDEPDGETEALVEATGEAHTSCGDPSPRRCTDCGRGFYCGTCGEILHPTGGTPPTEDRGEGEWRMLGWVLEADLDGEWTPGAGPLSGHDRDEMVQAMLDEGAERVAIHEAYINREPRIVTTEDDDARR